MKTGLFVALVVAAVAPPTMAAPDGVAVLINGVRMPRQGAHRVEQVSVEQVANAPDACAVELHIGKGEPADFPFDVGAELEVRLGGGARAERLFTGEVVSIEVAYDTGGRSAAVVRGFDRLHRLSRGRRTKTWEDVSDADIAARIAAEHGLRSQVDTTAPRYAYVHQRNESDLDFLRRRAARIGFAIDVEDHVLRFLRAPDSDRDPSLSITEPTVPMRLVTADIPGPFDVHVRGWDPVRKAPITAEASADAEQSGPGESFTLDGGDMLSEEPLLSDSLLFSQAEADAVAQAALRRLTGKSTTVQVETAGNPRARPGAIVEVSGVGERFDGRYFVSRAMHRFDAGGGYTTQLRLSRDAEGG
jgi:phage protein D